MAHRIALIHATPLACPPVADAFAALWPEAKLMNILDDSLSPDLQLAGSLQPPLEQRFVDLGRYAVSTGAQAILFTCSAFGSAIDRVRRLSGVPTLKPNEAMYQQALQLARAGQGRVGLLTSFAPAAASMRQELLAEAELQGLTLELHETCIPQAIEALARHDTESHDRLIAEAAHAMPACDVLMLGQFSMARSHSAASAHLSCPVLTSPHAAVQSLRRQLTDL